MCVNYSKLIMVRVKALLLLKQIICLSSAVKTNGLPLHLTLKTTWRNGPLSQNMYFKARKSGSTIHLGRPVPLTGSLQLATRNNRQRTQNRGTD